MALVLINLSEPLTVAPSVRWARADIERALAIWRDGGSASFCFAYGLFDRARLGIAEGRGKEAAADLEQAIAGLGDTDGGRRRASSWRACSRSGQRDRGRALALATEARRTSPRSPSEAQTLKDLDAWLGGHRL